MCLSPEQILSINMPKSALKWQKDTAILKIELNKIKNTLNSKIKEIPQETTKVLSSLPNLKNI
jgi:hypothetical protein